MFHRHGFFSPHRQRGQIAIAIAIAALMLSAAAMSEYSAWLGGVSIAARHHAAQRYVTKVSQEIGQWYQSNPGEMDGATSPVIPGCTLSVSRCLLIAADVPFEHGVIVSPGVRVVTSLGYAYRSLTVWIPKPSVTASARASFAPNKAFASASIDGRNIERAKWLIANNTVNSLTMAMQSGFGAWLSARGDVANDWFSPPGCGNSGVNTDMACASQWTDAKQMGVGVATSWAGPWVNPWGLAVQVCNTSACGANNDIEPYTALIITRTPWGGVIQRTAVEPLSS